MTAAQHQERCYGCFTSEKKHQKIKVLQTPRRSHLRASPLSCGCSPCTATQASLPTASPGGGPRPPGSRKASLLRVSGGSELKQKGKKGEKRTSPNERTPFFQGSPVLTPGRSHKQARQLKAPRTTTQCPWSPLWVGGAGGSDPASPPSVPPNARAPAPGWASRRLPHVCLPAAAGHKWRYQWGRDPSPGGDRRPHTRLIHCALGFLLSTLGSSFSSPPPHEGPSCHHQGRGCLFPALGSLLQGQLLCCGEESHCTTRSA